MICIESLQININRILLLAVGLWPYQQSKLVQLQLILFFSILMTFILFQFTSFVTTDTNQDVVINVLSSTLFYLTFVIKYNTFRVNTEVIKYLLELLQCIYNELKDENEITIIREYGQLAKSYTIRLTILIMSTVIFMFSYTMWPIIFYTMYNSNQSRLQHSFQYLTEYFVDQEKYFYLIVLHAIAAFTIGAISMLATGTILITFLQHACGMFRITSYRIEHAMTIGTSQSGNTNNNLIYNCFIYAVNIHRTAMQFSEMTVSKFKMSWFIIIIAGVACQSLNCIRIFQAMTIGYNTLGELLLPLLSAIILCFYMIMANYIAQEIIDHNNDVFSTICNIQWYMAPLNVQRMILFLLQRGTKTFNLNIGGLIVGSLENAAMILNVTLSYFTFLYAMRD